MADNQQLDGFLATGSQPDGAPPAQPAQPSDPSPAPEPRQDDKTPPSTPDKAAREAKKPEPDEDEALAQHVQGGDNRTVPFSALEKVRNDWKSKAAAHEARAELLARQLEEAKRPPPAPTPAPQPMFAPPPDFQQDPNGWASTFAQNQQRALLNERLNVSEIYARDKIGDDLDKYVTEFKAAAEREPTLWGKLYSQPGPYQWLIKEVDRIRQHAEIGDDPAAFRSRLEAELRAQWEAETQGQPAQGNGGRTSPAAGLPPSLANARSVAGRTTSTFTGPPAMEELFPGNHRRRPQQR
jgi:hypothetical protein